MFPSLSSPTPGSSFIGYLGKKGLDNVQTRLKWHHMGPPTTFFSPRETWVNENIYILMRAPWHPLCYPFQKVLVETKNRGVQIWSHIPQASLVPTLTALPSSTILVPVGFLQASKKVPSCSKAPKASVHQELTQDPEESILGASLPWVREGREVGLLLVPETWWL